MTQKNRINRIRVLYAVFLGVIALAIGLVLSNIIGAAEPLTYNIPGEQDDEYGLLITDLGASAATYGRTTEVEGMGEGLSATASVRRYDVRIRATDTKALRNSKAVWCMWLQGSAVIMAIGMIVLVVMALVSFYINVRRGKVFPRSNITWLTWAGVMMIAMSLCLDIGTYLERSLAVGLMSGSDWQPLPVAELHLTRVFFGLTIIFLAEIFKIGRDMQEEQELTI